MNATKRILSVILVLLTILSICILPGTAETTASDEITFLFTHDLHSHLLPAANETGGG